MEDIITMHFITAFTVWSFKLATLIVGYLIARMGYTLLLKGVTGGFKFSSEISGMKADLASASPGLLFLLLGVILMTTSVIKENSFSTTGKHGQPPANDSQLTDQKTKPDLFFSEDNK